MFDSSKMERLHLSEEEWEITSNERIISDVLSKIRFVISKRILHWELASEEDKSLCQKYMNDHAYYEDEAMKNLVIEPMLPPIITDDVPDYVRKEAKPIITNDNEVIDTYYFDDVVFAEKNLKNDVSTAINLIQLYISIHDRNISVDKLINNYFAIKFPDTIAAFYSDIIMSAQPTDNYLLAKCSYSEIKDATEIVRIVKSEKISEVTKKYINDEILLTINNFVNLIEKDYNYYLNHITIENVPNLLPLFDARTPIDILNSEADKIINEPSYKNWDGYDWNKTKFPEGIANEIESITWNIVPDFLILENIKIQATIITKKIYDLETAKSIYLYITSLLKLRAQEKGIIIPEHEATYTLKEHAYGNNKVRYYIAEHKVSDDTRSLSHPFTIYGNRTFCSYSLDTFDYKNDREIIFSFDKYCTPEAIKIYNEIKEVKSQKCASNAVLYSYNEFIELYNEGRIKMHDISVSTYDMFADEFYPSKSYTGKIPVFIDGNMPHP